MWGHPYQTWCGLPTHLWDRLFPWCGGGKLWIDITSAVWQLATRCLILWAGFLGQAIQWRQDKIESLRDVAMATNFGTKIAIIGFVWTTASKRLLMEGVLVVGRQKADIADSLQLRDVATTTTFWLSMCYNFSCMTASDMLFDPRGLVFGNMLSNEDIANIEG